MGADKSAENTPKVWDFDEKRLHWASVVRGFKHVVPFENQTGNSNQGRGDFKHTFVASKRPREAGSVSDFWPWPSTKKEACSKARPCL